MLPRTATSRSGSTPVTSPNARHEHERRGENDELGATGGDAGKEAEGGQRQYGELRCCGGSSGASGVLGLRRHSVQALLHDVLGANALDPQLRIERQAVCERHGDVLHILGRDEVAAAERRKAAGELQQRERAGAGWIPPERAGSDAWTPRRRPCRARCSRRRAPPRSPAEDRARSHGRRRASARPRQRAARDGARASPTRGRAPDSRRRSAAGNGRAGLGQRVRALVLDRVLGGQHEERALQRTRLPSSVT